MSEPADREKLIERIGKPLIGWESPGTNRAIRRAIAATLDYSSAPEFDAAVEWLLNSGEVSPDAVAQFERIASGEEQPP